LVIAGVAVVGPTLAGLASWRSAKASEGQAAAAKDQAKIAADASDRAANKAAESAAETTKLAAHLSTDAEERRWRRNEVKRIVTDILSTAQNHRHNASHLFTTEGRQPTPDEALLDLKKLERLRMELWLIAGDALADSAHYLYLAHVEAATLYDRTPIDRERGLRSINANLFREHELIFQAMLELGTLTVTDREQFQARPVPWLAAPTDDDK